MATYNVELRRKGATNFSTDGDLFLVHTDWSLVDNKPSTYTPTAHAHTSADISNANPPHFVTGNSGGTAGIWTGTATGVTSYYEGLRIDYHIRTAGSSTVTLDINGLGAKTVYRYGTSKVTTHYGTDYVVPLMYSSLNSGCWMIVGDTYDSVEDYNMRWENTIQFGEATQGYHLLMQGIDGKFYPVTSGGNGASTTNTITSAELLVGGTMLYYNTSTDISVNGTSSYYAYEGEYSSEMEYWSNKSSGWATAYLPFYIVGSLNANGNLILDGAGTTGNSFLTQTLPTTDDGKLYIQVGYMNNTYDSWRLTIEHPIYQYKDGSVRLYAGNADRLQGYEASDFATSGHTHSYLPLSGGTLTGDVHTTTTSNNYHAYNVLRFNTSSTPVQTVIYTKIKYLSSTHMPVVRIYGYAYGLTSPIELKIGFYIYGGNLGWSGVVSMGAWRPSVYLFKYTDASVDYVAIGLSGSCYFLAFQVDVQTVNMGTIGNSILIDGWTSASKTQAEVDALDIIIPAVGVDNCVAVSYKSTLEGLLVQYNGTTQYTYDGTTARTLNITPAGIGAATSGHNHSGVYEPVITKGTTTQYFRGDMSLATMPTTLPASDVSAWAKASTIAALSILGNNAGSAAAPAALTKTQVLALLNVADGATAAGATGDAHAAVTTGAVHGATTVGNNLFRLTNPSAITFLKVNADNSITARSASDFKTDLSLNNVTNESKTTMFTNPTFTGHPVGVTEAAGTNNTYLATTAFVKDAVDTGVASVSPIVSCCATVSVDSTTYVATGISVTLPTANKWYQLRFTGAWYRTSIGGSFYLRVSTKFSSVSGTPPYMYGAFNFAALNTSTAYTMTPVYTCSTTAGAAGAYMQTPQSSTEVTRAPIEFSATVFTGSASRTISIYIAANDNVIPDEYIGLVIGGMTAVQLN